MVNVEENIEVILEFIRINQLTEGSFFNADIEIYDDEFKNFTDKSEISITYDYRYGSYIVSILWSFEDAVMNSCGLHGKYSSHFQKFSIDAGVLKIKSDHKIICISVQ